MSTTTQHRYLEMLRSEHTGSILLIIGILLGGVMPWMPGVTVLTLAYGMMVRTKRCKALPGRTGSLDGGPLAMILFPLWPVLVSVDLIGDWMRETGFGSSFRVAVTAVLFMSCWLPFIDWSLLPLGVVALSAVITALLRNKSSNLFLTAAPSLIPIAIVIQRWSL